MKPVVLDTDVVSFLFKRDTRAEFYLPYLQTATEAEMEHWALLANWSVKRDRMVTALPRAI
jgi:hypothetical protein